MFSELVNNGVHWLFEVEFGPTKFFSVMPRATLWPTTWPLLARCPHPPHPTHSDRGRRLNWARNDSAPTTKEGATFCRAKEGWALSFSMLQAAEPGEHDGVWLWRAGDLRHQQDGGPHQRVAAPLRPQRMSREPPPPAKARVMHRVTPKSCKKRKWCGGVDHQVPPQTDIAIKTAMSCLALFCFFKKRTPTQSVQNLRREAC